MEKPAMNQFSDKSIKEALRRKADEIAPTERLFERINMEINENERKTILMNRYFNFKRVKPVVIITLVLILSAATVFAATRVTSLVSHSSEEFNKFPTVSQVEKAINYVPDYIEKFDNGFYFDSASVSDTAALDSDNNTVNESKGIAFFYTRDTAKKDQLMSLNADPEGPGISGEQGLNEEVIENGEYDLVYSQVTFKVVPPSYTPTEEENQLMEQGVLWISCGSEEVEISNLQYVSWAKDGIVYNLMDKGYDLEKDELLGMAKEVIGDDK